MFLSQLLHLLDLVFHLPSEFQASDWIRSLIDADADDEERYDKAEDDDDDNDDNDMDNDNDDNEDDDGHQPLYLVPVESEGVHRVQIDWSIILSHQ